MQDKTIDFILNAGTGTGIYLKAYNEKFDVVITAFHCVENPFTLKLNNKELKVINTILKKELDLAIICVEKVEFRDKIIDVILDTKVIKRFEYTLKGFPDYLEGEKTNSQELSVKLNSKNLTVNDYEIEFNDSYVDLNNNQTIGGITHGISGGPLYEEEENMSAKLLKGMFYEMKTEDGNFNMGVVLKIEIVIKEFKKLGINIFNVNKLIMLKIKNRIDKLQEMLPSSALGTGDVEEYKYNESLNKIKIKCEEIENVLFNLFCQIKCNDNLSLSELEDQDSIDYLIFCLIIPGLETELCVNKNNKAFIYNGNNYWFFNPINGDEKVKGLAITELFKYIKDKEYIREGRALLKLPFVISDCINCPSIDIEKIGASNNGILSTAKQKDNFMHMHSSFKLLARCSTCLENFERIKDGGKKKWGTYY